MRYETLEKDLFMIRSANITNFRCFRENQLSNCKQLNVIVGDSGSGKTALLEAIFLAMGSSPELGARFRDQRGMSNQFTGSVKRIKEALWEDLFFSGDHSDPVWIELEGSGPECRSLEISWGAAGGFLPFSESDDASVEISRDVVFRWRSAGGQIFEKHARVSEGGIQFDPSDDDLMDFFFFSASNKGSSIENASRYSELSKANRENEFRSILSNEFDWISDVSLEVSGGSPAIYANAWGLERKTPLNAISGGVNKLTMYALAMLISENSVILIDEFENGLYFDRYKAYWDIICNLAKKRNHQIFLTTHSKEMLQAISNSDVANKDDLCFFRLSKKTLTPEIEQFRGDELAAAIEFGEEVR